MRTAALVSVSTLVLSAACATTPKPSMQPDPNEGYMLETTGAVVGTDRPTDTASTPSLDTVASRLAAEICAREQRCGNAKRSHDACLRASGRQVRRELASWRNCSPAIVRARSEECLASVRAEPCALDLSKRTAICGREVSCEVLPAGQPIQPAIPPR